MSRHAFLLLSNPVKILSQLKQASKLPPTRQSQGAGGPLRRRDWSGRAGQFDRPDCQLSTGQSTSA
ncbi:MAG: hypothetical protein KBC18_05630 [Candidatus Saccharicenans sp.]|nr:hypothetical protein [Candidatus Saccharicenans sp.]